MGHRPKWRSLNYITLRRKQNSKSLWPGLGSKFSCDTRNTTKEKEKYMGCRKKGNLCASKYTKEDGDNLQRLGEKTWKLCIWQRPIHLIYMFTKYKKFLKLGIEKKKKQPNLKWRPSTHTSWKKIHKWLIITWKDTQY